MMMFLFLMDWMFSSSPSIKPFDHPVYDIWLQVAIKLFFLYQAN